MSQEVNKPVQVREIHQLTIAKAKPLYSRYFCCMYSGHYLFVRTLYRFIKGRKVIQIVEQDREHVECLIGGIEFEF